MLISRPAEPSAQLWKSRTALTRLPGKTEIAETQSGTALEAPVDSALCYACLTVISSQTIKPGSVATVQNPGLDLPIWVGERIGKNRVVSEDEMRKEIGEFLI
jgi:hypothetical protein